MTVMNLVTPKAFPFVNLVMPNAGANHELYFVQQTGLWPLRAALLNNSSYLAPALGLTKFTNG
jgi:hypothetical protein